MGKEIGKGAYAVVKFSTHKPSSKKVAIKIYDKVKLNDVHKRNAVKREIEVLKKLDHPNVVKLHEIIETIKQTFLIMELVQGTSLLTYLKAKPNRRAGLENTRVIFNQLTTALNYCHTKHICHRDIKLENIIIEEKEDELNVKLIDFGFASAVVKNKMLNFFCGTPSYMPPEIVQKKDYLGLNSDIWCLGILLYTLCCGSFPFRGVNEKELYSKIVKGEFPTPEYLVDEEVKLLRYILKVVPTERPTSEEVSFLLLFFYCVFIVFFCLDFKA